MRKCPACMTSIDEESPRCPKCGKVFEVVCPICDATNEYGMTTCGRCQWDFTSDPKQYAMPFEMSTTELEDLSARIILANLSYESSLKKPTPSHVTIELRPDRLGIVIGSYALVGFWASLMLFKINANFIVALFFSSLTFAFLVLMFSYAWVNSPLLKNQLSMQEFMQEFFVTNGGVLLILPAFWFLDGLVRALGYELNLFGSNFPFLFGYIVFIYGLQFLLFGEIEKDYNRVILVLEFVFLGLGLLTGWFPGILGFLNQFIWTSRIDLLLSMVGLILT